MRSLVEHFDQLSISEKIEKLDIILSSNYSFSDIYEKLPKVAIVMATYNRLPFLLTYLYSCLLQKNVRVKFYISDDHSSDETREYMEYLKNKYPDLFFYHYSEKNIGPSENRKIALQQVTEELMIFSDDDDYYIDSSFIMNGAYSILMNKQAPIFFGSALIVDTQTHDEREFNLDYIGVSAKSVLQNLFFTMKKPPSTFLFIFRLDNVLKGKLLNMSMLNDGLIYLLILNHYSSGIVSGTKSISGVYREHSSNMTKSLDFNFILENIYQKITLLERVSLPKNTIRNLKFKHIKMTIEYFKGSNQLTSEQINVLSKILDTYKPFWKRFLLKFFS